MIEWENVLIEFVFLNLNVFTYRIVLGNRDISERESSRLQSINLPCYRRIAISHRALRHLQVEQVYFLSDFYAIISREKLISFILPDKLKSTCLLDRLGKLLSHIYKTR